MLNDLLKDLMKAIPSAALLIWRFKVPVKCDLDPAPEYEDLVASSVWLVVPIQLAFLVLIPLARPDVSLSASVIAALMSMVLILIVASSVSLFLSVLERTIEDYRKYFASWATFLFTLWFFTLIIGIVSLLIGSLIKQPSADVIGYLFHATIWQEFTYASDKAKTFAVIATYTVLAYFFLTLIYGLPVVRVAKSGASILRYWSIVAVGVLLVASVVWICTVFATSNPFAA